MSTNPFRRGGAAPAPAPVPAPAPAPVRREHTAHSGDAHTTTALTPLRAHYLKTTLVSLQLQHELSLLMQRDALAMLGPPFRGAPAYNGTELPLMRHFLRRFVLTFPFFATAPPDFFPNTVQVFMEQLLARNIIVLDEADGDTTVATTVVRRAERETVTLARHDAVRPEAIRYLNRLSDLLFVAARLIARRTQVDEVLWQAAQKP